MQRTILFLRAKSEYSAKLATLKINEEPIFSQNNIQKIISAKEFFPENVDCILEHIDFLAQNFSGDKIASVAAFGKNHILSLIDLYPSLKNYIPINIIFTILNLVRGNKVLKALHDHLTFFINNGFTIEQITKIATHPEGDLNLIKLKEHIYQLLQFGFTVEEMVIIAGKAAGHKSICLLENNFDLLKPFNFTRTQLITMIESGNEHLYFRSLENNHAQLIDLGFSYSDINRILCNAEGFKALSIVNKHYPTLIKFGLEKEHILFMVDRYFGYKSIEFVAKNISQIQKCGFTITQYLAIIASYFGIKNLNAILKHHEALKRLNINNDHCVAIGKSRIGAGVIDLLANNVDFFITLNVNIDQLVKKISSHNNGLLILNTLISKSDLLLKSNFTGDQMVILLYEAGPESLDDAILFADVINDPQVVVDYLLQGIVGRIGLCKLTIKNLTGVDVLHMVSPKQLQEYAMYLIRSNQKMKSHVSKTRHQMSSHKRKDSYDVSLPQPDYVKKRKEESGNRLEENNPLEFNPQDVISALSKTYTEQEILQMLNTSISNVAPEATPAPDVHLQPDDNRAPDVHLQPDDNRYNVDSLIDVNSIHTFSDGMLMLEALTNKNVCNEISQSTVNEGSLQQFSLFNEKELEEIKELNFEWCELPITPSI